MSKGNKVFSPEAERDYYESGPISPLALDELNAQEADMRLWIPDLPFLFRGRRVLDFGAGQGRVGIVIAQRFAPTQVVSLELVYRRIQSATAWARSLTPLSLVCGDAFQLPFKDGSFDFVVANSVLHHLPQVNAAIAEIARVLCPGGFYIGREPNFNNPLLRMAVFALAGTVVHRTTYTANEYPLRAQEIIQAFAQNGCRCEMHYFWRRLPRLRHPILSIAMSVRAQRLSNSSGRDSPSDLAGRPQAKLS